MLLLLIVLLRFSIVAAEIHICNFLHVVKIQMFINTGVNTRIR